MTDTPMHRETVAELNNEQLDALIQKRRDRRNKPVEVFKQAQAEREQLEKNRAKAEYDKQLRLFEKDLGTADRALDRLEQRARKLQALRLQWIE